MKKEQEHIDESLLLKVIENTANEKEKGLFNSWLKTSTENVEIFEDLDFSGMVNLKSPQELTLTIHEKSKWNGFLLWLNLHTIEGEVIDILEHRESWLPVYFPLWHPGTDVFKGDVIQITCQAATGTDNLHPDYRIEGRLIRKSGDVVEFSYESVDLNLGSQNLMILDFTWPEIDSYGSNAHFYGALLNHELTEIIGNMGTATFGWAAN